MSMISDRIKTRREDAGLSLAELARRTGISKGYLHNLESGDAQSPSADILFKLATALGTTMADLLGEEEPLRAQKAADVPDSLREFAREANLPEVDVQMLANIQYRGKRPANKEDWQFIYESIKRTLR